MAKKVDLDLYMARINAELRIYARIAEAARKEIAKRRNKATFGELIFSKVKKNPAITHKRLTYEIKNVRSRHGNNTPALSTIVTYHNMARAFLRAQSKAKAA